MKYIFSVGGTGGHIYLAKGLYEKLKEHQILFAGHEISQSPYLDLSIPTVDIAAATPFSKNPLKMIRSLFVLAKGTWGALNLLRREAPDMVVGFGSFHSFPVLF